MGDLNTLPTLLVKYAPLAPRVRPPSLLQSEVCFALMCLLSSPVSLLPQTDVFLKSIICCKTWAEENQLGCSHLVKKTPTGACSPILAESGRSRGGSAMIVMPTNQWNLLQRGVGWASPLCLSLAGLAGSSGDTPCLMGHRQTPLLPAFFRGPSGPWQGLLISAYNGKCVAVLNAEPLTV